MEKDGDQKKVDDEEESKELMSDFPFDEDEAAPPPPQGEEGEGGLKRPRPSDQIAETMGSVEPPPKKRRLHKKLEKEKKSSSSSSSSSGEEEEEEKKPVAPVVPKSLATSGEIARSLENSLFGLDDLYEAQDKKKDEDAMELDDDESKKKKKKVLDMAAFFPEDDKDKEEKGSDAPLPSSDAIDPDAPIVLVEDGRLPCIGGTCVVEELRCVYAQNPAGGHWTPLAAQGTSEMETLVQQMPWGIFAPRAYQGKAAALTPVWSVLIAPMGLMIYLASPFFACRMRMIRVDPSAVKLEHGMPTRPIYYVLELVEKIPLWRGKWTLHALFNLLFDTLYGHVECCVKQKSKAEVPNMIKSALSVITCFPLDGQDPSGKLLPPAQVPLTTLGARTDRRKTLKDIWETPSGLKNNLSPAEVDGCLDTQSFLKCLHYFHSNVNFLFTDLEKPSAAWHVIVSSAQFDCLTFCRISHWDQCTPYTVSFSVKLLLSTHGIPLSSVTSPEPTAYIGFGGAGEGGGDDHGRFAVDTQLGVSQSKINHSDLHQLAALVPLDLAWFSRWFGYYFSKQEIEEDPQLRLRLYALFGASEVLHEHYENAKRYGTGGTTTFALTKARRDRLFKSGAHLNSPLLSFYARLDAKTKAEEEAVLKEVAPPQALTEEEEVQVRGYFEDFLVEIGEARPRLLKEIEFTPSQPLSVKKVKGEVIIVDPDVSSLSLKLASLILRIATRWQHSLPRDSELRSVPPLLPQYATTYGRGVDNSLSEFYDQLTESLAQGKAEDVLFIYPDLASATASVNAKRIDAVKKRSNSNQAHIRILVFDRFHLWGLDQLREVLALFKDVPALLTRTTHFIVTAHTNTISETSAGGNFMWDLLSIADQLTHRFRVHSMTIAAAPSFDRFSRWGGQMSEQMYEDSAREEQYALNLGKLELISSVDEALKRFRAILRQRQLHEQQAARSLKTISSTPSSSAPVSLTPIKFLILVALVKTQRQVQDRCQQTAPELVSGAKSCVTISTYENMLRGIRQFENVYTQIVFADAHYEGPGRFTYHHINAAFERCDQKINVIMEKGEPPREALEHFRSVFMQSDAKTDRLNAHVGRCPLVQSSFEQLLLDPRIEKVLEPLQPKD